MQSSSSIFQVASNCVGNIASCGYYSSFTPSLSILAYSAASFF